jgi:hypothetical protein
MQRYPNTGQVRKVLIHCFMDSRVVPCSGSRRWQPSTSDHACRKSSTQKGKFMCIIYMCIFIIEFMCLFSKCICTQSCEHMRPHLQQIRKAGTCKSAHTRLCVCMCVYVCVCARKCMCVSTHSHIHIYTHFNSCKRHYQRKTHRTM